eukprot:204344-Amphidinium_carterae.1
MASPQSSWAAFIDQCNIRLKVGAYRFGSIAPPQVPKLTKGHSKEFKDYSTALAEASMMKGQLATNPAFKKVQTLVGEDRLQRSNI